MICFDFIQVIEKYEESSDTIPTYVTELITSSERFYNLSEENAEYISYDAYDKDIAMVQVFFKTATVVQIGSRPRYSYSI